MASEQFSLCWDNFHKNMSSGMSTLLENEDLVDVTLAVEGRYLKAHKMVLSVCSPYFKELFKSNPCKHPIVFMKDVSYIAMNDLLIFMYQGEVQVSQENLSSFIKTAEALHIKGLTGDGNGSTESEFDEKTVQQMVEESEIQYKQQNSVNSRPKKIAQSIPHSSKRQRLSTSTNESLTDKKGGQTETVVSEEIHFKMEPYDQTQSITVTEDEEQDGDSTNEIVGYETTEDFSMMEANEDEPQAGTSADGTGEGQDVKSFEKKRKPNMPRYIVDGFVFHVNITKGNPPMIYLRCLEYKRLGCHARAVLPLDGSIDDIKINKPHNHPPDHCAEEKIVFMRELKEVALINPSVPSRSIYATLSEMYPNAAREIPFDVIRHKMSRWRRQMDEQQVKSNEQQTLSS